MDASDITWLTDGIGNYVFICQCGNVEITPHECDDWHAFDGVEIDGADSHKITCGDCGRSEKLKIGE